MALRSSTDPMALGERLREVVAEMAPDQPVSYMQTLDGALAEAAFTYRFSGALFLLFGAVALFLAALGLYAVMSFQVGRRTHEMGVRLAVGARRGDLLALVLRGGLAQVALGLVPGLALGIVFSRLVTAFLYRVESAGLPALAAVALTLLTVGLLASWLPARRAARVDPMTALRTE
jgi:ABC-type antimicrobial peptide transport system permease subunit